MFRICCSRGAVRPARAGTGSWRSVAGLLLIAALLGSCAVNPVTHESQLSLLSESQEVRMGGELYPLYTQMSEGLLQDDLLQRYVQSVGRRLAAVGHRPEMPYEFNVVNSSELNAYALPGGKISITRGLVSRMQNEAQLASVLAHEIGHVAALHPSAGYTRQVLAQVITTAGLAALQAANIQGADLIAQGGQLVTNLTLMKYSRDQEREADELGMEYMVKAGYSPQGFVQAMQLLMDEKRQRPGALEAFMSSHPLTDERVATASQRAAQYSPAQRAPALLKQGPFEQSTRQLKQVKPAYQQMDQARKQLSEKNYPAAVGMLRNATAQAPKEALIWTFLSAAETGAGQKRPALEAAETAVRLYPDLFRARYTAGIVA
ncbi:MAG: hypothetical protein COT06_01415, partial [Syntrophobacteraceae bacterium CG07_land_8_20_14_0_80_61_8]